MTEKNVYVDQLFVFKSRDKQARRVGSKHNHQWSHMWGDDLDALHAMADSIGMKRAWFKLDDPKAPLPEGWFAHIPRPRKRKSMAPKAPNLP